MSQTFPRFDSSSIYRFFFFPPFFNFISIFQLFLFFFAKWNVERKWSIQIVVPTIWIERNIDKSLNIDYDYFDRNKRGIETFVPFVFSLDFLPTFGPSFLHFYGFGAAERSTCFGKCFSALPLYRGRVLVSLKTEIDDSEMTSGISVKRELAVPIIEVCIDIFHIRLISSSHQVAWNLENFYNFFYYLNFLITITNYY